MTGMDDRLRAAMQGDTHVEANAETSPRSPWQSIETAVAKRASRRRAWQRVALVSAVALATAAMVGALTGGPGGGIDPTDPTGLDESTDQRASTWTWPADLSGWAVLVLALGVLILVVVYAAAVVGRWRATDRHRQVGRLRQDSARHTLRRAAAHPERLIALALILLGLGLPVWAYVNYVDSIGDLQSRSPDFATVEELQVTSTRRTWTPFAGPLDPLVSVALAPTGSADEAETLELVDEVLAEAGFVQSVQSDIYYRVTYGDITGAGAAESKDVGPGEPVTGVATNDSATVKNNEDGTVHVGYQLRGEPTKSWIPLAVFIGTFGIAGAAALLMGYLWARPLGLLALVATTVQVGLVVRGFSTARSLLIGADRNVPLATERAGLVSAATTDTYPLGLLAVVFLLAPWSLGALAAFSGRKHVAAALAALGLVAVVVIFAIFGSINGWVLEILE